VELVSKIGQFSVWAAVTGEVRIEVEPLDAAEMKHGAMVRGLDPGAARQLAAELLNAADEADRNGETRD
jgi:hypothetical protein